MENKNQIEKTCENCRYYARHYTKYATRLIKTNCGHCTMTKNKDFPYKACKRWQELIVDKNKMKITKILENISDRLTEIALFLKDDAE